MSKQLLLLLLLITLGLATWEDGVLDPHEWSQDVPGSTEEDGEVHASDGLPRPP